MDGPASPAPAPYPSPPTTVSLGGRCVARACPLCAATFVCRETRASCDASGTAPDVRCDWADHLVWHVAAARSRGDKFACPLGCGKVSADKTALLNHLLSESHHAGLKHYVCDACNLPVYNKGDFQRHCRDSCRASGSGSVGLFRQLTSMGRRLSGKQRGSPTSSASEPSDADAEPSMLPTFILEVNMGSFSKRVRFTGGPPSTMDEFERHIRSKMGKFLSASESVTFYYIANTRRIIISDDDDLSIFILSSVEKEVRVERELVDAGFTAIRGGAAATPPGGESPQPHSPHSPHAGHVTHVAPPGLQPTGAQQPCALPSPATTDNSPWMGAGSPRVHLGLDADAAALDQLGADGPLSPGGWATSAADLAFLDTILPLTQQGEFAPGYFNVFPVTSVGSPAVVKLAGAQRPGEVDPSKKKQSPKPFPAPKLEAYGQRVEVARRGHQQPFLTGYRRPAYVRPDSDSSLTLSVRATTAADPTVDLQQRAEVAVPSNRTAITVGYRSIDLTSRFATLSLSPNQPAPAPEPASVESSPPASEHAPHWAFTVLAGTMFSGARFVDLPANAPPLCACAGYNAGKADEVTVSLGDFIKLKTVYRDGWGFGINLTSEERGMLPLDCLRITPPATNANPEPEPSPVAAEVQVPQAEEASTTLGHTLQVVERNVPIAQPKVTPGSQVEEADVALSGGLSFTKSVILDGHIMGSMGAVALARAAAPRTNKVFYARTGYKPASSDEIELVVGDRVCEHQSFDDGWSYGANMRTNKEGFFPHEFVVAVPVARLAVPGSAAIVVGPASSSTTADQKDVQPKAAGSASNLQVSVGSVKREPSVTAGSNRGNPVVLAPKRSASNRAG